MIYVVEDDNSIRELVVYTLNAVGLEAVGFAEPAAFWQALDERLPALVVLDIMLPDEDGLHILRRLRAAVHTQTLPVLMLTAKGSEYDKVAGLDSGADDYVTKPFGTMELVARIKALLRRSATTGAAETVHRVGGVCVYPQRHRVTADGREVTLTLKEYELLCLLLTHPDRVFTRDQILDRIWGYAFDGENRTVDVHIRTLRHKLGTAGSVIETVRGVGYRIGGGAP